MEIYSKIYHFIPSLLSSGKGQARLELRHLPPPHCGGDDADCPRVAVLGDEEVVKILQHISAVNLQTGPGSPGVTSQHTVLGTGAARLDIPDNSMLVGERESEVLEVKVLYHFISRKIKLY